jgi:hypothetical protein
LKRWVLKSVVGLVIMLAVCGLAGLASAAAFNVTLQRPMSFASESVSRYVLVGLRSNGMLIVTAVLFSVAAFVVVLLARLLCLLGPVRRARASARQFLQRTVARLGLDDPGVLAGWLAALGLIATLVLWWRFGPLLNAFVRYVSTTPPQELLPLAPGNLENLREWRMYRLWVNIVLLVLGGGLVLVYRLRARTADRRGTGAIVLATAIFGFVVAMHVLPYRIMYENAFEKVDVAGDRCYLLGQRAGSLASSSNQGAPVIEALIYCPDLASPRVRRVNMLTTPLQRTGIFESIFTTTR